jgi:hypothetical protein
LEEMAAADDMDLEMRHRPGGGFDPETPKRRATTATRW